MKLFAIITAGLMAAGGGIYFYSTSTCSKSGCNTSAPVAKTGGCCLTGDKPDCCATQDACCVLQEACCSSATSVSAKTPTCCAAKEECCIINAACCTATKASAVAKPVEIEGCCAACAVTPTSAVAGAAKSIATAK